MSEWTIEKVKEHYIETLKAMVEAKTNLVSDSKGAVWAFGPWYGGRPHFRSGFGHWSEDVLNLTDEWRWDNNLPLTVFIDDRPPFEDADKWSEFFLTPIGDKKDS